MGNNNDPVSNFQRRQAERRVEQAEHTMAELTKLCSPSGRADAQIAIIMAKVLSGQQRPSEHRKALERRIETVEKQLRTIADACVVVNQLDEAPPKLNEKK